MVFQPFDLTRLHLRLDLSSLSAASQTQSYGTATI
jgi:hypothetical protein